MNAFPKALRNMRRTPYQAVAAIMVLSITFFITVLIGFVTLSLNQALAYFESRPQILIFFETDVQEVDIFELRTQFEANPKVVDVTYIPQEEALDIYRELNKNDPMLLELVTADILPASLEVSARSLEALESLRLEAEEGVGVEEVVLRSDVVNTLNQWLTGIKYAGGSFVAIMALTSILIVVVVVGMKISGRNFEVKIMRLMGASSWYIQAPYVVEGALYGLISATIAYTLALSLLLYASPFILEFAGEVPLFPQTIEYLIALYGIVVSVGLTIGVLGSMIAVKRFLKL